MAFNEAENLNYYKKSAFHSLKLQSSTINHYNAAMEDRPQGEGKTLTIFDIN